jgi:hypothetical protein
MSRAILLHDAKELLLEAWPSSGWQTHSSWASTGTETTLGTNELKASRKIAVVFAILLDNLAAGASSRVERYLNRWGVNAERIKL